MDEESPPAPGAGRPADRGLVDVIDHDGRVTAVVSRAVMRRDNLRHRSVGILVMNSAGEVLVHRRAETKDVWPGQWDIAAGGVVESGEAAEAAARRELGEELGIEGTEMRFLGEADFEDGAVRCRCSMFEVRHDGPVRFADGEVAEARWVPARELADFLRSRRVVPDSVAVFSDVRPDLFAG
jgi:8-oxo-dGTP pyrophosphatase MutT (NUDIX family)